MYKKIKQLLSQLTVDFLFCDIVQMTSQEPVVAYQVQESNTCNIFHTLKSVEQKIYIVVEKNSVCTLAVFEPLQSVVLACCKVEFHIVVLQDAQFEMNFSFIHTLDVDCTIHVYLEGDRAKADVLGLYALGDQQKVSIKTYQYHSGVDSVSNLVVKGMLQGWAQATYSGLIKIDECAKRANASQENKNIMLSKHAKVISEPTIEVLQFDVQCCHGSAIGKFDQDDMWYLQSKGILPDKAQELLVKSFFQDVAHELENQDEIMDVVCNKMKQITE